VAEKKKKRFIDKLHNKYRLIMYNDTTFQSIWSLKLSRLKVFTLVSLGSSVLVILTTMLIVATPLKEYIPGYPKKEYRQLLFRNAILVDSLEGELRKRDVFFQNMKTIINGEIPSENIQESSSITKPDKVEFLAIDQDSIFLDKILEERVNLSYRQTEIENNDLSNIHFFVPVKGIVTNKFNKGTNHLGIDMVSTANSVISSVLNGTVIFAGWTLDTGYVIYIQHKNNLVSVYKHNAELLKDIGENVNAGEAIAIIGNSGELSTGPHLHFELWHNGAAIDPEQYINF
jgi:murein DD-endopeptidase MepM/ murein hydrolase activator NlpD